MYKTVGVTYIWIIKNSLIHKNSPADAAGEFGTRNISVLCVEITNRNEFDGKIDNLHTNKTR